MKLAVILHIYYLEQIPDIRAKLQNLDNAGVNYDLFITSPHSPYSPNKLGNAGGAATDPTEDRLPSASQSTNPAVGEKFCEMTADVPQRRGAYIEVRDPTDVGLPSASQFTKFIPTFIPTENRGYDIAPFLHALKSLNLDEYDYVLKLHTKGTANTNYTKLNGRRFDNALWGKMLWDSLLKSPERLSRNIEIMQQNQNIGMLSSAYCLTSEKQTYEKFLPQINEVLQQLNLPQTNTVSFIAGTMFIAKASLLKPLQKIDESRFTPTDSKVKEGTYAHLIERVFGAVITAQNHKIYGLQHDNYGFHFFIAAVKRFLYQKKHTTSGNTLIKICKIPVYARRSNNA